MSGLRKIKPFRWTGERWCPVEDNVAHSFPESSSISIATLNILHEMFPWFVKLAIASHERFSALVTAIERLDADVLALNEVSPVALRTLLSAPFIRQNYCVSEDTKMSNASVTAEHGCLLLCKRPFASLAVIPLQRSAVAGVVMVGQTSLTICSLHTTAHQNQKSRDRRRKQIATVAQGGKTLSPNVLVLGDLNMHDDCEDATILKEDLLDLWLETHHDVKTSPGFTFDPINNSMIHRYIPGERRRMRLDRMLLNSGASWRVVEPVTIWADKEIRPELFLSDHFGLHVQLAPSVTGMLTSPEAKSVLMTNAKKPGHNHSVKFSPRFVWALLKHVGWLAGLNRYPFAAILCIAALSVTLHTCTGLIHLY